MKRTTIMSATERRQRLIMRMSFIGRPQIASTLAFHCGWDSQIVRADLRYLEREGKVRRLRGNDTEGRPHSWEVV